MATVKAMIAISMIERETIMVKAEVRILILKDLKVVLFKGFPNLIHAKEKRQHFSPRPEQILCNF